MHGKTDPAKPQFGIASNVRFMLRTAWRVRRGVLWLCLAQRPAAFWAFLLRLRCSPPSKGPCPWGSFWAPLGYSPWA